MSETLWNIDQLAEYLHTTAKSIYTRRVRDPDNVPPAIHMPGRLLWEPNSVRAWVMARTRMTAPRRKLGRPRKVV